MTGRRIHAEPDAVAAMESTIGPGVTRATLLVNGEHGDCVWTPPLTTAEAQAVIAALVRGFADGLHDG